MRASVAIAGLIVLAGCSASSAAPIANEAAGSSATVVSAATELPTSTSTSGAPATSASGASTTEVAAPTTDVVETADTTTVPATSPPVIDPNCPSAGHGAVIDRDTQQAWLCDAGVALPPFPITTAVSQPDPGVYPVFAKDLNATSTIGGHFSRMTHFVAFTRGKNTGARIAFHSVPTLNDGSYAQPLESVGTPEQHGASAGCIRVLPDQAVVIWDWLQEGDEVHVIS